MKISLSINTAIVMLTLFMAALVGNVIYRHITDKTISPIVERLAYALVGAFVTVLIFRKFHIIKLDLYAISIAGLTGLMIEILWDSRKKIIEKYLGGGKIGKK